MRRLGAFLDFSFDEKNTEDNLKNSMADEWTKYNPNNNV